MGGFFSVHFVLCVHLMLFGSVPVCFQLHARDSAPRFVCLSVCWSVDWSGGWLVGQSLSQLKIVYQSVSLSSCRHATLQATTLGLSIRQSVRHIFEFNVEIFKNIYLKYITICQKNEQTNN